MIINSKCAAISTDHPNCKTKRFFKATGNKTIKAAPANEPKMEPSPPIMTINKTTKDF